MYDAVPQRGSAGASLNEDQQQYLDTNALQQHSTFFSIIDHLSDALVTMLLACYSGGEVEGSWGVIIWDGGGCICTTRITMAIRTLIFSIVLFAGFNTASAQGEWVDIGSTHEGDLSQLASSRDGHLAGIEGRYSQFTPVWSTDEGQTWNKGKINLQYAAFPQYLESSLHFFTPAIGVVTVGEWLDNMELGLTFQGELALTNDSGRTWHGSKSSERLDKTGWPARLQYGLDGNVILLTDDTHHASKDGLNWFIQQRGPARYGPGYYASTLDLKQVVKLKTDNIRVSVDSGISFTQQPTVDFDTDSSLSFYDLQLLNSGAVIAEGAAVYKSDDGHKWQRLSNPSASHILAYRFNVLYLANKDTLLISSDDGQTWSKEVLPAPILHLVPVTPSLTYLLAGNKIYKRALPASVHKITDAREITISPNPVINELKIHSSVIGEISIIDITGREVLRTTAGEQVDVSSLPNGVYQLLLPNGGEVYTQRFVIAR
jgi:hypothetical protein